VEPDSNRAGALAQLLCNLNGGQSFHKPEDYQCPEFLWQSPHRPPDKVSLVLAQSGISRLHRFGIEAFNRSRLAAEGFLMANPESEAVGALLDGNLAEPPGKSGWITQAVQLRICLEEALLGDIFRLGRVGDSAQCKRDNHFPVSFHDGAEAGYISPESRLDDVLIAYNSHFGAFRHQTSPVTVLSANSTILNAQVVEVLQRKAAYGSGRLFLLDFADLDQ
jgi:hypothetical protein